MKRFPSLLLPLLIPLMAPTHAQKPHSPAPSSAEYKALLATATEAARSELKHTVTLDAEVLNVAPPWAFLSARILGADGAAYAFEGTRWEAAAAAGGMSNQYVGLLRETNGRWAIVQQSLGPTDVVWESWAETYGAPTALFAID